MPDSYIVRFSFNKIYFFISLKGVQRETANDLYRAIDSNFENCQVNYFDTKNQLFDLLKLVKDECRTKEVHPLVHIESHGLDTMKGLSLNNGESVYWTNMRPLLMQINSECCNNLSIILSACNSSYVQSELRASFFENLSSSSPFFSFVGCTSGISFMELFDAYEVFYNSLATDKDISKAVTAMNIKTNKDFKTNNSFTFALNILAKFMDSWVKNRFKLISENAENFKIFCNMYYYTYGKNCDEIAIQRILSDEKFYLDFIERRMWFFLNNHRCGENANRYPRIASIENFERSINDFTIIPRSYS